MTAPQWQSADEVRAWLRQAMLGHISLHKNEILHRHLAALYEELAPAEKDTLQLIVIGFLDELTSGNEQWNGTPGRQLLSFSQTVLAESPRRARGVTLASRIIEAPEPLWSEEIVLTAAQTALALGYHGPTSVWLQLAKRYGNRASAMVIEALARTDWQALTEWLAEAVADPVIERTFLNHLRYLNAFHPSERCAALISAVSNRLSPSGREEVLAMAAEAGFSQVFSVADLDSAAAARALEHLLLAFGEYAASAAEELHGSIVKRFENIRPAVEEFISGRRPSVTQRLTEVLLACAEKVATLTEEAPLTLSSMLGAIHDVGFPIPTFSQAFENRDMRETMRVSLQFDKHAAVEYRELIALDRQYRNADDFVDRFAPPQQEH